MSVLETAPFTPELASPEELRAWYEVFAAVNSDFTNTPVPPYDAWVRQLRAPSSHYGGQRRWDARENGRVLGTASAIFPMSENHEVAIVTVRVRSEDRRAGVGTRLLQAILPEIGELGRRTVTGTVRCDGDGEKWANALGLRTVLRRSSQHLDIPSTDPTQWQVQPAPGFRLHQWLDTAPNELVQGLARARNAMADRPMGDATYQHQSWTAERVRQYEARTIDSGNSHRYVVAVDERSGTVAGFTEIAVFPGQSTYCRQEETAVLPEYRGLGLGRAMKAAMMRWLVADMPRMEQVRTMTASENLHMLRVNTQLGYQTDSVLAYVESEVSALETLLNSAVRPPTEG